MKVYWIERDAVAIADTSDYVNFKSPTDVKQVTLFVTTEDEKFVSTNTHSTSIGLTESSSFPEEFHEALALKVIQQGYEQKPELIQMATYFENQYNLKVAEAKRVANKGLDGSTYSIKGYDY